MVVGAGFEPAYSERTDLQSVAFNHSATPPILKKDNLCNAVWSHQRDLNPRPTDYKSVALPTELWWPTKRARILWLELSLRNCKNKKNAFS